MISGINASLSGLHAYGIRMQNNSHNVANLNTDGFKKGRVLLLEQSPQGVRAVPEQAGPGRDVSVTGIHEGVKPVEPSSVELGREMVDMIENQYGFMGNIKVLQAVDEMAGSLLDIKT